MSHAYYPDEEPTHFAIVKIETTWVNKTKDPGQHGAAVSASTNIEASHS